MFLQIIAKIILKLIGWKLIDKFPNTPKQVLIIAPHTSNWDFIILILAKWGFRQEIISLGKEDLFKIPFLNIFLRQLGILPVDRQTSHNMVQVIIKMFKARKKPPAIAITPEGTRAWTPYWRSGFYYIAIQANLSISCLSLDYKSKTVQFGLHLRPSQDINNDMQKIRDYYQDKLGKNPKQQGPIKLK